MMLITIAHAVSLTSQVFKVIEYFVSMFIARRLVTFSTAAQLY